MINIAVLIGISLAVTFLFVYMFVRDKEIEKRFRLISMALERIHQDIYKLQKQKPNNPTIEVDAVISAKLDEVMSNLSSNMQELQFRNQQELEALYDKIAKIEGNVKTFVLPNLDSPLNKKDNREIVRELQEIGYSYEDISKETGIPVGEVQLLLKF